MDWAKIGGVIAVVGTVLGIAANFKDIVDLILIGIGRRPRISVRSVMNSDPYEGNEITMTNRSAVPLLVDRWDLVWAKPRRFRAPEVVRVIEEAEYDYRGFTIPAHDRKTWMFSEGNWFPVNVSKHAGHKLLLRLHPVGGGRPHVLDILKTATLVV